MLLNVAIQNYYAIIFIIILITKKVLTNFSNNMIFIINANMLTRIWNLLPSGYYNILAFTSVCQCQSLHCWSRCVEDFNSTSKRRLSIWLHVSCLIQDISDIVKTRCLFCVEHIYLYYLNQKIFFWFSFLLIFNMVLPHCFIIHTLYTIVNFTSCITGL